VSIGEVADVDIIPNGGAIEGLIISAEDLDNWVGSLDRSYNARDEGCFGRVVLTGLAVGIGSGRIK
jgi:hypothetical protein